MKTITIVIPVALALSLGACGSDRYGPKQTGGAVIGAAAGGLLGSKIGSGKGQLAATAAGALAGLLVGSEVGRSLDRADRLYAARSREVALETFPTGRTSEWVNPDSGHSGSVTPMSTYETAQGGYCREYRQTVTIAGRRQTAYGTACRQPDGSWRVLD